MGNGQVTYGRGNPETNRKMKRCPNSSVIQKKQIETTINSPSASVRWAKIRKLGNAKCGSRRGHLGVLLAGA